MPAPDIDALREIIQPSLDHARVELIDLKWGGGVLRIIIDKPEGVRHNDCERVSMAVSAVLDTYDPIPARYQLEVSSPGAERPLRTYQDWHAAIGKHVNVRHKQGDAEVVVEGLLVEVSETTATVESKQRTRIARHTLALDDVLSARIAVAI